MENNFIAKKDSFSFEPSSFQEAKEMSEYIAQSGLIPLSYQGKPSDILVAYGLAKSLGLPWLSSLKNISVINGTASLWGDAFFAVLKRHPQWRGETLEAIKSDVPNECGYISTMRRFNPYSNEIEETTQIYTLAHAKAAGLYWDIRAGEKAPQSFGKGGTTYDKRMTPPWASNTMHMVSIRARHKAAHFLWPDVLMGIDVVFEKDVVSEEERSDMKMADVSITPLNSERPLRIESVSDELLRDLEI
jgi:hypothetical protein